MTLPGNYAPRIKSIPMEPVAVSSDLQLAYMLSFTTQNITSSSIHCSPRDTHQPALFNYSFVDFDEPTYKNLLNETNKNFSAKKGEMVRGIREGFKQFYMRVASTTYASCLKYSRDTKNKMQKTLTVPTIQLDYKIETMRGNIASKWPENMNQFNEELGKLPWNAFSADSEIIYADFCDSIKLAIANISNRMRGKTEQDRKNNLQILSLMNQNLLGVALRTNNQTFILENLKYITDNIFDLNSDEQTFLCTKLSQYVDEFFQLIPQKQNEQLHYCDKPWDLDAFMIMKKIHFSKQAGLSYLSCTTDGKYLYIFVSSLNGGMFKIGTGYNGSVPGKIYLEQEVFTPIGNNKLDEVNWVYLKGKIYLKTSSRDPGNLQIINPQTFKSEGSITLHCPSLFGHQSLLNINKNSLILTDGQFLYFLGKRLRITKGEDSIVKKQKEQGDMEEQKSQDDKKKKPKKIKKKNDQPNNPTAQQVNQNIQKVLQIVLFKFDVNGQSSIIKEGANINEGFVQQLYESFNGYFTIVECRRALNINNYDLPSACQWLVDEGQDERQSKIYASISQVIIAESQIVNELPKNLKTSNEIVTKDTSILHIQNINQSIWTMDSEHLTCYSQNGIKIFSKDQKGTKISDDKFKLASTLVKIVENRNPRNPEYYITYDHINEVFLTFVWPLEGNNHQHYFPTAVLISSDKKASLRIGMERRCSIKTEKPLKLQQFGRSLLLKLCLFQGKKYSDNYRTNNWLWYYGQKLIDINTEMKNPDSDKKKFQNKRTKILLKMNKINQTLKIHQKEKLQWLKYESLIKEVKKIYPFEGDGSIQNIKLIKSFFNNLPNNLSEYLVALQNWVQNCDDFRSLSMIQFTQKLGIQLLDLRAGVNNSQFVKINQLLINNFFLFFPKCQDQMKFIFSLSPKELSFLSRKQNFSGKKQKQSIMYEVTKKTDLIQKFESKCQYNEIYKSKSTIQILHRDQVDSIGNFLLDTIIVTQRQKKYGCVSQNLDNSKRRKEFFQFLEKGILNLTIDIKFFQFLFVQAFKLIVTDRKYNEYLPDMISMFTNIFKLFQRLFQKSQINVNLVETLLLVVQVYYGSLISLTPNTQIITSLIKIIQYLHKPELKKLHKWIEFLQFEGISQTTQKIYETTHPISRGKNNSYPTRTFADASLILVDIDKRCQSDQGHDFMSIQTLHQDLSVGTNISCNDGIFTTNIKKTGKVQAKKPEIMLGNSVKIQFSISAHANNAQSFFQYGFKFGLRPIFAGKIKYQPNSLSQIQPIFGSKQNFQKYINTLKFTIVATSHAIQQIMNLPKLEQEQKASHYLNGKIFKEGFEEEFLKNDKFISFQPIQIVNNFFASEPTNDFDKILKKIHQSSKVQPVPQKKNLIKQDLWNFEGIPSYIRSYLEQIKQFKGDFIDVFKSAREHVQSTGKYALQLRRSSFLPQFKELWLKGESILFLTVLKHSGLLHLNLKFSIQYIKQNLKAFEEARNGIFYAFISRMQTVRQWSDLVETYWGTREDPVEQKQVKTEELKKEMVQKTLKIGKKGNSRTVKLQNKKIEKPEMKQKKSQEKKQMKEIQKPKAESEKQIRERLTQEYLIQQLCNLKSIKFVKDQTYDNVTGIIESLKLDKVSNIQRIYEQPMEHLIRSCLFLLRLKSPNAQEKFGQEEELVPSSVSRAFSQDNRHVNVNKVNLFREWLENWKKWKGFKKDEKLQLKFPVTQIVDFVNSWIPPNQFVQIMNLRLKKALKRVEFYQFITLLVKTTSNSIFGKYALGLQTVHLPQSFKGGLQSVSSVKISQIQSLYHEYNIAIKQVEKSIFKELPLTLSEVQKLVKNDSTVLFDKIKHNAIHLYLAQTDNQKMNLDVALYFIPFKHLSQNYEQIICLSNLISQTAFLCNHSIQDIIGAINKQVGRDSFSSRRWKDFFFIERILFLLRKLETKIKKKIQFKEKIIIAESLFYLIYQTEIPLISRISLRIIKSLKINLKENIKTPFDYEYITVRSNQLKTIQIAQRLRFKNTHNFNNLELLYKKCSQSLTDELNPIKSKLFVKPNIQAQPKYNLILSLHNEEDIVWMVKVLYYIEQIQKTMVQIKSWADYQTIKAKKKQQQKEKQREKKQVKEQQQQQQQQPAQPAVQIQEKTVERLLANIPQTVSNIDDQLQNLLPVGWFYNYCNVFSQFISKKKVARKAIPSSSSSLLPNPSKQKKNNNNNVNNSKRPWALVNFQKLVKKFQDLNSKPPQEPKEEQSNEIKAQFIKARNFITRIKKHCYEVSVIASELNQFGYYLFREEIPLSKVQLLAQIITLGSEAKLQPIPCVFTTNDLANRLTPNLGDQPTSSKIKLSIIKTQRYAQLQNIFNIVNNSVVLDNKSHYYSQLNQKESSFEDVKNFLFEQLPRLDYCDNPLIEVGKQYVESGLCQMRKKHDEVCLKDYPNIRYFISQGGMESGLKQATLVPNSDSLLTLQMVNIDLVQPAIHLQPSSQTPEELIEKIIEKIKNKLNPIDQKKGLIPYILISSYLKKLSEMDLKFVQKSLLQQLGICLYQFIKRLKSNQPIHAYKRSIQELMVKLWQNQNEDLNIFRIYQLQENINPTIQQFVKPSPSVQQKDKNAQKNTQSLNTHHYPKSQYLLSSQPPQIQENKLLKYWQKNILPRILQFVKTTLRPLEIEDFFQQIRIPLRVNDQNEAKKIAYVICDNKLPQGAVLPDANHNWNSLSVEDIVIGQHALIKFTKNKSQLSSPLLGTFIQDHRLVQIVFVQHKNASVLVRYRLEEYGILTYMWVSINSLVPVEIPIGNYTTPHILKQLQTNFQGIIYGYSKLCLTQLIGVAEIKPDDLIKQTIVDMLVDDPISGWLGAHRKQWPMRKTLQKLLQEDKTSIIDNIEKQFYTVRSFEVNLLSEKMISLNRFQNASGLIISFKKTAVISLCSGIKFYSDPYGFNQVAHLYTAKTQKNQFTPLQFKQTNLYARYYTNKDCLRMQEQNKYNPKPIQATVFQVNSIWTISCYLADVISEIAVEQNKYLHILTRFNKLFINWIMTKQVAVLCGYACRLVSRISHRISQICKKTNTQITQDVLGINQNLIEKAIEWINQMKNQQSKQTVALYSCLLQNLSQMTSSLLCRVSYPGIKIPEHVEAMISMMKLIEDYDLNLQGKATEVEENVNPQWERLLAISNIPTYISPNQFRNSIIKIFQDRKGKILSPKYDIFHSGTQGMILVDGWDITQLVEEEVMEKIQLQQQEQEKQPQQEQSLAIEWTCEICTFINQANVNLCQLCQAPMPIFKNDVVDVYQMVQATDVNQAEKRLKEKEAKRFQVIKKDIQDLFEKRWKIQCQKREQQIKDRELRNKNKEFKKKKSQQKPQEPVVIPQKPKIVIETGSNTLKLKIIEQFLKMRFDALPSSIRDKVPQGSIKYLDRFRALLKLGFDLWGDNVSNETPTLLKMPLLKLLMRYIQGQICKQSSSVLSYSEDSIRVLSQIPLVSGEQAPINFIAEDNDGVKVKYKLLADCKCYNIRYSWRFIKQLNLAASKCLQFVNMNLKHEEDKPRIFSDSLGSQLKYFRSLIMGTIKLELSQKIIQKTSILREAEEIPKVVLERLRIREEKNRKRPVTPKDRQDYLFTKAHQQFAKVSPAMLRPFKPKGADPYLCFTVMFKGELVMGEAGPYRQFFTDIGNQLDPKNNMGLFIGTPNNQHKMGESKSKWTINPKANSSYHLSLYQFFGSLMGCCIRTGTHLAVDLPKLFWKQLVDEKTKDEDLEEVDFQLCRTIQMIIKCPSVEYFEELQQNSGEPLNWVYTTSDGSEYQIIPGGKNIKVEYKDREQYVKRLKECREKESDLQIKRIKKGIENLVPSAYLNCLSGEQVKLLICGRPKIDVDLLKKHTKYAGGLNEQSPRIVKFWEIMRQIQEQERLKLIRFCWGQQRLPINSQEFQRNNIRFMIKPMMGGADKNQDQALPKADTCFFNIQLPNYSTKEIMKNKILLAINLDNVSINADDNPNPDDNPLLNNGAELQPEEDEPNEW